MSGARTLQEWVDARVDARGLRARVDEALGELLIVQDLIALRERRGLSQVALAARVGVSQPAIAKIESGRVRNLELRTILRVVTALGGRLTLRIDDGPASSHRTGTDRRRTARGIPATTSERRRRASPARVRG